MNVTIRGSCWFLAISPSYLQKNVFTRGFWAALCRQDRRIMMRGCNSVALFCKTANDHWKNLTKILVAVASPHICLELLWLFMLLLRKQNMVSVKSPFSWSSKTLAFAALRRSILEHQWTAPVNRTRQPTVSLISSLGASAWSAARKQKKPFGLSKFDQVCWLPWPMYNWLKPHLWMKKTVSDPKRANQISWCLEL